MCFEYLVLLDELVNYVRREMEKGFVIRSSYFVSYFNASNK